MAKRAVKTKVDIILEGKENFTPSDEANIENLFDAIVGKNSQQVELTLKHERKKTTTDNHKLVKTVKLAFSVEYNGFEDFMEVFRHSLDKISIVSQASVKDEPLSTKISIVFEIPEEQAWSETELALYQSTIEVTSQTRRELVYKHGHMKSNRRRFKHLVTTLVFPDMEKNLPFVVFHCVHHFKLTSKDPTNQDENIYQDDNDDQTSYVISSALSTPDNLPRNYPSTGTRDDWATDGENNEVVQHLRHSYQSSLSLHSYYDESGSANQVIARHSDILDPLE